MRNGSQVDLLSRNQLSFNDRFPEVVAALAKVDPARFVLDGELVVFDGDQTSFTLLQSSPHPDHLTYCVFDLLYLDGRYVTPLGLIERQALLAGALGEGHAPLSLVKPLQGEPSEVLDLGVLVGGGKAWSPNGSTPSMGAAGPRTGSQAHGQPGARHRRLDRTTWVQGRTGRPPRGLLR